MDTSNALAALGAVTIVLLAWRLALTQHRGKAVGRPSEATITWTGGYTAAFQRSLDICGALDIGLVDADPHRGIILGRTEPAVLSSGPNVRITLRTQEGITTVTVSAASRVVEVGQSQRLAKRFVEVWDRMPDPV